LRKGREGGGRVSIKAAQFLTVLGTGHRAPVAVLEVFVLSCPVTGQLCNYPMRKGGADQNVSLHIMLVRLVLDSVRLKMRLISLQGG
jgi:hypothetical protein